MVRLALRLATQAIKAGVRVPKAALVQKFIENCYLAEQLRNLQIDCLLDVGANKGQYAERVRQMGYGGHIFSFEPIPADFEHLRKASATDRYWHVFQAALGRVEETREFNVIGGNYTVFSSFLAPLDVGMPKGLEKIPVTIKTLDSMFPEIEAIAGTNPRVFLKMDTQGYDLEVCMGAPQTIGRVLALQSELSVDALYEGQPKYTEALDYFEGLGFALMNLSIVNRSRSSAVMEYDCLMARLEALADRKPE